MNIQLLQYSVAILVFHLCLYLVLYWLAALSLKGSHLSKDKVIRLEHLSRMLIFLVLFFSVMYSLTDLWEAGSLSVTFVGILSGGVGVGILLIAYNFWSGFGFNLSRQTRDLTFIQTNGIFGNVTSIRKFYTEVTGIDGVCNLIPNSKVFDESIMSYKEQPVRRITIKITIPRNIDLSDFVSRFQTVMADEPSFVKDPAPEIMFNGIHTLNILNPGLGAMQAPPYPDETTSVEGVVYPRFGSQCFLTVYAWIETNRNWQVAQSKVRKFIASYLKDTGTGPQLTLNMRVDDRQCGLLKLYSS